MTTTFAHWTDAASGYAHADHPITSLHPSSQTPPTARTLLRLLPIPDPADAFAVGFRRRLTELATADTARA